MRMRVKKHVCVQKHIPSVKKHPLAWLWVALCVLILLESRVCDWTERLVAEKSSFEGSGSLQIEQAILFAGNAGESDSLYDLTVTLHNVGGGVQQIAVRAKCWRYAGKIPAADLCNGERTAG